MNKSPGRPRAADLEARNQNLVDTAGQLFLKLGYGNVSLETIAREAHVAVRTIYVKFGGKSGLFKAVLVANRDRFITPQKLEGDERPLKDILTEFSEHFLEMISQPDALAIQRMVIAEARTSPEVAQAFYDGAQRQTRAILGDFFSRPAIRCQLRDDVPMDLLPTYLTNCVVGDPFARFLFDPAAQPREEVMRALHQRLEFFYRSVLKQP